MVKSRRRFRNFYKEYTPEGYDEAIVNSNSELMSQIEKCRKNKHKRFTHDVYGRDVKFRSLVCCTCNKKYYYVQDL